MLHVFIFLLDIGFCSLQLPCCLLDSHHLESLFLYENVLLLASTLFTTVNAVFEIIKTSYQLTPEESDAYLRYFSTRNILCRVYNKDHALLNQIY